MVGPSHPLPSSQFLTSSFQDLPLQHNSLLPRHPLSRRHSLDGFPTPIDPRRYNPRQLHIIRVVAGGADRDVDPAVRQREREWELPAVCDEQFVQGGQCRDVGVVDE